MTTSTLYAINGSNGRVSVNGNVATATKYGVNIRASDLPTTSFNSTNTDQFGFKTCFEESTYGIQGADITWEGSYDTNTTPFGGLGIFPGQQVDNVYIFVNKYSSKFFSFPLVAILTVNVMSDVNGLVTYSVTAKSSGPFLVPI
jgi:hypothetical protein